MWFPEAPSWTLARRAVGIDTDEVRTEPDFTVVELAVENGIETWILAGLADQAPRVVLSVVPWRTVLWLASHVKEDGDRDDLLFADRGSAEALESSGPGCAQEPGRHHPCRARPLGARRRERE